MAAAVDGGVDACVLYVTPDGCARAVRGAQREGAPLRLLRSCEHAELCAFAAGARVVGCGGGWRALRDLFGDGDGAETVSVRQLDALVERALAQAGVRRAEPPVFGPVIAPTFFETIAQRRDPRAQRACALLWQKKRGGGGGGGNVGDVDYAEACLVHADLVAQSNAYAVTQAVKRLKKSKLGD